MPVSEDALLEELTSSMHSVLGDDLVGLYLYGSYVSGGFDPGISDLDLAAVTTTEVEMLDLAELKLMHDNFVDCHPDWIDRIEVVYIGGSTLESIRTSAGQVAVISPGEPLHRRNERAVEWLQNWYLVRETGVMLYGPPPERVVPPVALTEFVAAAARYAEQISTRSLHQEPPGAIAYSVLTMCRAHMTVMTDSQVSKQAAAAWTMDRMPDWAWLVDSALASRRSCGTLGFDDPESRAAAEQFIALVAERLAGRPR